MQRTKTFITKANKAGPYVRRCEVSNPKHVRRRRMEHQVDVIQRAWCRLVLHPDAHGLAMNLASQIRAAHHLPPDFPHAANLVVLGKDTSNLGLESDILPRPRRKLLRIGASRDMGTIGRGGDRQTPIDRLYPIKKPSAPCVTFDDFVKLSSSRCRDRQRKIPVLNVPVYGERINAEPSDQRRCEGKNEPFPALETSARKVSAALRLRSNNQA